MLHAARRLAAPLMRPAPLRRAAALPVRWHPPSVLPFRHSHSRRAWLAPQRAHSSLASSGEADLLSMIRSAGTEGAVELEDVLEVIDAHYDYTPVAFTNGPLENAAGENVGSCKLLFWAQLHGLTSAEVLFAFGRHYSNLEPDGTSHQNIRTIVANGVDAVQFTTPPLSPKH